MNTKHILGPWKLFWHKDGGYEYSPRATILGASGAWTGITVTRVGDPYNPSAEHIEEREANAILATAAPELLTELESTLIFLIAVLHRDLYMPVKDIEAHSVVICARAVIAKAKREAAP